MVTKTHPLMSETSPPPTPNSLHFDTQLNYYLHPLPDGAWLDVVVIVAVVEVKIMVVILLIVIVLVVLMVSVGCFSDRLNNPRGRLSEK